jgi:excisionase family DNA binding protein
VTGVTADAVAGGHYVGNMAKDRGGEIVQSRFLTLRDVAVYLNMSEAQAYALVRSGELPAIKIGGRGVWRVDRQRLEAFLDRLHEETAGWVEAHPLVEPRPRGELRIVGPRPLPEHVEAVNTVDAARIIGVTRQNVSHLIRTGSLRARNERQALARVRRRCTHLSRSRFRTPTGNRRRRRAMNARLDRMPTTEPVSHDAARFDYGFRE